MKQAQRFFAILAMILAIILFSSMILPGVGTDHVCDESGCRVCSQIHSYENLLKNISAAGMLLSVLTAMLSVAAAAVPSGAGIFEAVTLVSHKVKLSN